MHRQTQDSADTALAELFETAGEGDRMKSQLITAVMALQLSVLMAACATACAQKATAGSLGWDLSYSSVLDANSVGPDEWIRKWIGPNYQSAAKGWISSWNHGPIKSAVLLEFPAHAGERIIMCFIRTKDQAYYYERAEGSALLKDDKPPHETSQTLDVQAYDRFFSAVSTWQQASPPKPEETRAGAPLGYMGFLSLYSSSGSRQMLLTSTDYAVCETKECKTWKRGRLFEALVIIPEFGTRK
jgi:hypothetical protein